VAQLRTGVDAVVQRRALSGRSVLGAMECVDGREPIALRRIRWFRVLGVEASKGTPGYLDNGIGLGRAGLFFAGASIVFIACGSLLGLASYDPPQVARLGSGLGSFEMRFAAS